MIFSTSKGTGSLLVVRSKVRLYSISTSHSVAEELLTRASDVCRTVKDRSVVPTVSGASRAIEHRVHGITFFQGSSGLKLLATAALVVGVAIVSAIFRRLARAMTRGEALARERFWSQQ